MRPRPFRPSTVVIESIHAPYGDLCYEAFRFNETTEKGGAGRFAFKMVTHSDLLPVGGTYLQFAEGPVNL